MIETSEKEEPIYPAATVVLVRDGAQGIEALLVQRSREVRHMGGMWVFPGGRVDPADNVPGGDEYAAAVNAAIRETHEEAGLVIDPDQLLYISHWTTPKGAKRRFATWFFLVFLEEDQEVQVDGGEIVHHRWLAPQVAFDESADEREEMSLMPPTYVSLVSIEPYDNCEQARAALAAAGPTIYEPRMVQVEGGICFLYDGDAGYAEVNVEAVGDRHRTYMVDGTLDYQRQQAG